MRAFLARGLLLLGIALPLADVRGGPAGPPIAELVRKLKDSDYATRYEAAMALEKLGARAEPAIPALIDALGDQGAFNGSNSDHVSTMAARTLLVIGPPALPALTAAVKGHPDARVRWLVFWILGTMGREAQTAIPVLQAALRRDTDRVAAALALRQIDPEGELVFPAIAPQTKAPIPTLIDSLRDPGQREAAADALKDIGPDARQAVPALTALLKDENYAVRAAAAGALGAMKQEAAAAAPALKKALDDSNWYVRYRAVPALAQIAPRDRGVAGALARLLKDPESNVRGEAARALGQMRPAAEATVHALIEALQDPAASGAAATALGEIGPPAKAAVPALMRAMKDPDTKYYSSVRCEATGAVGGIGPDARAAIPALIQAFEDKWNEVPPRAVASLVRIGPAAVPALRKAVRDGKPGSRVRAAEVLGRLGPAASAALPSLREALTDDDGSVRVEAALALWRIEGRPEAALPVLLEVLQAGDYETAGRAAEALRLMGPAARPALPALLALLDGNKVPAAWLTSRKRPVVKTDTKLAAKTLPAAIRWAVVHSLHGMGPLDRSAAPVLAKALRDRPRAVGLVEAAWILAAMGADAEPAVPVLIAALGDEDEVVRWTAADVLGQIGHGAHAAVPALTRALRDPQPVVRVAAAYALGRLGPAARPAVSALAGPLQDPNPVARWASLAALRRLGPFAEDAVPDLARLVRDRRSYIGGRWSSHPTFSSIGPPNYHNMWSEARGWVAPEAAAFQKSPPLTVPELAIQVLTAIGPAARAATPALLAACHDERVTVRLVAAAALEKIDPEALARAAPTPGELAALWEDLSREDEENAYRALWTFVLAPRQAVPWLRARLRPVPPADAARIARLITDLGHEQFAARQRATADLKALAELAGPALKKALAGQPPPEVRRRAEQLLQRLEADSPTPEQLRTLRALAVLRRIGTAEGRQILVDLSQGDVAAAVTQEAKAALAHAPKKPDHHN